MEKYLGIDVGGTEIKYALMTEEDILEKGYIPTPSTTLDDFIEAIAGIYDKYRDQTDVIVMSAPGRIDSMKGYFYTGGALHYVHECNVADLIKERTGVRAVAIENDGKAAGLAEVWKGNLQFVKNGVIIGIGTGLAGAIVVDGKMRRGSHFSAGEVSLLMDNFRGDYWGSLWAMSNSTPSLIGRYRNHAGENCGVSNGREFFEKYNAGDELAKECLDDFCFEFVNGIMTMQAILDADRYCIGGGISQQPAVVETMNRKLDELYAKIGGRTPVQKPEIVACKYHNDANLIGALFHWLYEMN